MRIVTKAAFAGIASLALVAPLAAKTLPTHVLNVALPDGSTAAIRYTGDVPPEVAVTPAPAPFLAAFPGFVDFPGFAQIAAVMDRDAIQMLQQVAALAQQPGLAVDRPLAIDMTSLPPGVTGYSVSSTLTPQGWCSETVEITRNSPDAAPQMVRHSAGNCGATQSGGVSAPVQALPPSTVPQRLMVRSGPQHYALQPEVQRVAWQR